jgi:hypothetical protein
LGEQEKLRTAQPVVISERAKRVEPLSFRALRYAQGRQVEESLLSERRDLPHYQQAEDSSTPPLRGSARNDETLRPRLHRDVHDRGLIRDRHPHRRVGHSLRPEGEHHARASPQQTVLKHAVRADEPHLGRHERPTVMVPMMRPWQSSRYSHMPMHMQRCRVALVIGAVAAAGCGGDRPTSPPAFAGRYVLASIDGRPAASVVYRYTTNGESYETTVAGDTIEVLGASTMRRGTWFRTTLLRSTGDSVLPLEEAQYCGTFSRVDRRIEFRLQIRRCSEPESFQVGIDSLFLVRNGVSARGMRPGAPITYDAEWWFAPR